MLTCRSFRNREDNDLPLPWDRSRRRAGRRPARRRRARCVRTRTFAGQSSLYISAPIFGLHRRLPGAARSAARNCTCWLPGKRFASYTISRCRVASSSYRYRTDSMQITMLIVPGGVILPAELHDLFSFLKECADCLSNEALRKDGIARLERVNDALVLLKASDPLLVLSPRSLNTHHYERE